MLGTPCRKDDHQHKVAKHLQDLHDALLNYSPPSSSSSGSTLGLSHNNNHNSNKKSGLSGTGASSTGTESVLSTSDVLLAKASGIASKVSNSLFSMFVGSGGKRSPLGSVIESTEGQSFESSKDNSDSSDNSGVPKGVYLYGDVGSGKTLLMDMFFETAPTSQKRRVHFHEFMLDVHSRVHVWKQEMAKQGVTSIGGKLDPIPPVAQALADEAWLLCFDEFQVCSCCVCVCVRVRACVCVCAEVIFYLDFFNLFIY